MNSVSRSSIILNSTCLFNTKYLFSLAIDRFNQFLPSSTKLSQDFLPLLPGRTAILSVSPVWAPGMILSAAAPSAGTRSSHPLVADPFSFLLSISGWLHEDGPNCPLCCHCPVPLHLCSVPTCQRSLTLSATCGLLQSWPVGVCVTNASAGWSAVQIL